MHKIFDIKGKKAIVTGGSTGLGKACVEILHEFGAEVYILDKNEEVKNLSLNFADSGAPVNYSIIDLSDRKQVKTGFDKALKKMRTVDILVNNAGVQHREKCVDFPLDKWDEILNVNLTAAFILIQLCGKIMLEKGSGKIINIASLMSFLGGQKISAYAASKGGIAQLTKAFSNEWAKSGVCINAIAPGYMDTPLNKELVGNTARELNILTRVPAGRWGVPADIQGVLIFLASKASDFVTGTVIPIDGGYLAN